VTRKLSVSCAFSGAKPGVIHSIAGRLPLAKAKIGYAKSEFERQKSSIGARPAAIKYINLHNQNTIHYR
jgi:hypothetical protein